MHEHRGVFMLEAELLDRHPHLVEQLMNGVVVTRCEALYNPYALHYSAMSMRWFKRIDEDEMSPQYHIRRVFTRKHDHEDAMQGLLLVRLEFTDKADNVQRIVP